MKTDHPAIVKDASELKELASHINNSIKSGLLESKKSVDHFKAAGIALMIVKERVGFGNYTEWIGNNLNYTDRHARRMVALAKTDGETDLETKWRIICGMNDENDDTEEEPKTDINVRSQQQSKTNDPDESTHFCRSCRMLSEAKRDPKCKRCIAERKERTPVKPLTVPPAAKPKPPPEPPKPLTDKAGREPPEQLTKVFEEFDLWADAHSKLRAARKAMESVEASESYKRHDAAYYRKSGDTRHIMTYSTSLRVAARYVNREMPWEICRGCLGITPSADADECSKCDGKGFLTKQEAAK